MSDIQRILEPMREIAVATGYDMVVVGGGIAGGSGCYRRFVSGRVPGKTSPYNIHWHDVD